jgi:hypothetical protein
MKKVSALVLAALLTVAAHAHAQTLRGVVVDDGTSAPIADALVELVSPDARMGVTARTDSAGRFLLRPARAGRFVLRMSQLGYAPLLSDTLSVRPVETLDIEARLSQAAIPLEPLVVTARRRTTRLDGFYERQQNGGLGRYVTREEIDRRPGARTTDLLRMMPGVSIVPQGGRGGVGQVNLITMRGTAGGCLPTIYLDGMPIRQYPESGMDEIVNASMLEGVEVYSSFASAPAPIHARDNCGVVAFWTRAPEGGTRWSWRRLAFGVGSFALLVLVAAR